VIRAGATHAGGYRVAKISTPPLIVAEGESWVSEARDGSRWVTVAIEGARAATFDDLNVPTANESSPLAMYSDELLINELKRRGYVVTRAAAGAEAQ